MGLVNLIWKKKFVIICLALLIVLLPMAATKQVYALSKSIITGVGIDYQNGEYLVFGERVIFNFDPFGVQEWELHSVKAPTIKEAVDLMGINQGSTVSFSHCSLIVVGPGLKDKNLIDVLGFFFDRVDLNNTAVLMYTEDDVEKLMNASIELGTPRRGHLQQLSEFNRKTKDKNTSLENFFKSSLRPSKTAKMTLVTETDGEIQNQGKVAIFIDGIFDRIETS